MIASVKQGALRRRNPIREVVTVSKNPLAESFATPWLWGAVAVGTVVGIGYAIYKSRQKAATPPATNKNTFPAVPPMHLGDRPILSPNESFLVLGDGYAMSVTAALGNDPTLQSGQITPWSAPLALSIGAARDGIASLPPSIASLHVVLLAFSPALTDLSTSGDIDGLDAALVAAGKRPIWILAPGDEVSAFGSYVASVPAFEYYAMGEGSIAGLVHELTIGIGSSPPTKPDVSAPSVSSSVSGTTDYAGQVWEWDGSQWNFITTNWQMNASSPDQSVLDPPATCGQPTWYYVVWWKRDDSGWSIVREGTLGPGC